MFPVCTLRTSLGFAFCTLQPYLGFALRVSGQNLNRWCNCQVPLYLLDPPVAMLKVQSMVLLRAEVLRVCWGYWA